MDFIRQYKIDLNKVFKSINEDSKANNKLFNFAPSGTGKLFMINYELKVKLIH